MAPPDGEQVEGAALTLLLQFCCLHLPSRPRVVFKANKVPILKLGLYSWRGDGLVGRRKALSLLLFLLLSLWPRKRLHAILKKQPVYDLMLDELATVIKRTPFFKACCLCKAIISFCFILGVWKCEIGCLKNFLSKEGRGNDVKFNLFVAIDSQTKHSLFLLPSKFVMDKIADTLCTGRIQGWMALDDLAEKSIGHS